MASHPATSADPKAKAIRTRIRALLENSLIAYPQSNILFICGGNDTHSHMRPKFLEYVNREMTNVLPLFPEHALSHHIGRDGFKFTDLSKFEKLIGEACFCIVLFPEAPGSFAELGMFSVLDELNKKTLACLNLAYQADDSFISTGPVTILDSVSLFKPAIQISYEDPNFDLVKGRIESRKTVKWERKYKVAGRKWSEYSSYHKLILILYIIRFLRVATQDDIKFTVKSLTGNQPKSDELSHLLLILLGCGIVNETEHGNDDYFSLIGSSSAFFTFSEGYVDEVTKISEKVAELIAVDALYSNALEISHESA